MESNTLTAATAAVAKSNQILHPNLSRGSGPRWFAGLWEDSPSGWLLARTRRPIYSANMFACVQMYKACGYIVGRAGQIVGARKFISRNLIQNAEAKECNNAGSPGMIVVCLASRACDSVQDVGKGEAAAVVALVVNDNGNISIKLPRAELQRSRRRRQGLSSFSKIVSAIGLAEHQFAKSAG